MADAAYWDEEVLAEQVKKSEAKTDQERNEYRERILRVAFLRSEHEAAKMEIEWLSKLVQITQNRINEFTKKGDFHLPDHLGELAIQVSYFARTFQAPEEKRGAELAPLLVAIFETKSPTNPQGLEAVKAILATRAEMAHLRREYSAIVSNFALHSTLSLSHFEKRNFLNAFREARESCENVNREGLPEQIREITRRENSAVRRDWAALRTDVSANEMLDQRNKENQKYDSLATALLDNPSIPRNVKDEIRKELDFNGKYGLPLNIFFKAYLDTVQSYFYGSGSVGIVGTIK